MSLQFQTTLTMKKIIILSIALLAFTFSNAQETSKSKKTTKKNDSITQIVNLEVHYQKDFSLNYN